MIFRAAIDLDADAARKAVAAAHPKRRQILDRLRMLAAGRENDLLSTIIPFDGALAHADRMLARAYDFVAAETGNARAGELRDAAMALRQDKFMIALNALSNSSRTPVTEDDVVSILRTGVGPANLARALFEDCSFSVLMEIALSLGMTQRDFVQAYSRPPRAAIPSSTRKSTN